MGTLPVPQLQNRIQTLRRALLLCLRRFERQRAGLFGSYPLICRGSRYVNCCDLNSPAALTPARRILFECLRAGPGLQLL